MLWGCACPMQSGQVPPGSCPVKTNLLKRFLCISMVENTSSQCDDNRGKLPGNPFESWLGKLYQVLSGKVSVENSFF